MTAATMLRMPRRPCRRALYCTALVALGFLTALRADDAKQQVVKLVIDYNDGAQKVFPAIAWKDGLTVLDALEEAKTPAHGITFKYNGKGETAFLTQIDDLKNEGGGKEKKNWQYWINSAYADRGFGVRKLSAGDTVVWKFAVFEDK
jgi:uncharacterized protein DUF4430